MNDPDLYISIGGALQYMTLTQPDITFSVNKECQFMVTPLDSHWSVVKCILRYHSGISHHGLLLLPTDTTSPISFEYTVTQDL